MRKSLVTFAAAMAVVASASLVPSRADAAGLNGAAGLRGAVGEADLSTQVDYVCSRVWRCGPFGCGFRSVCGWRPGSYSPHWGYRGWGGRPHWRSGW